MKLVWTKKAQKRMGEILDYIQLEFGNIAKAAFITKAKDFTKLLKEFRSSSWSPDQLKQ